LNALQVLEAIRANEQVGVSELARRVNLPKATVQRVLLTFGAAGWLSPTTTTPTRWEASDKLFGFGIRFVQSWDLRTVALPLMSDLRNKTGEAVNLLIPQSKYVVHVERLNSLQTVGVTSAPGGMNPIHATAGGKAILAKMSDAEVRSLLGKTLERCNEHTITRTDKLITELATIRTTGFAVSWQEWQLDVVAVGAAITNGLGKPIAALSATGPATRMTRKRVAEVGPMVTEIAAEIGNRLRGHS